MVRPIAISLSPNTENDDLILAIKTFCSPWKWFDESEVEKLEIEFAEYFGKNYKALAVNSGRSAQYLILKALGIGKGDEVGIQAFTCVAVPNSILWLGARPIYIDIDESYNMDINDLKKKFSKKMKAIVVQHTFGIPAELDSIKKFTRKHKLLLIEDCSHSLGATFKGKLVGTLTDVSFFSFGRDKVLSSVFGGVVLTSNYDIYKKIKELREKLPYPPPFWVFQQLMHPLAFSIILPLYNLGLGKFILVLLQKTKLLSKAVYEDEKKGKKPKHFPTRMPGALATLARNQFTKLERYNKKRKDFVNFYLKALKNLSFDLTKESKGAIWLRYPIRHPNARNLFEFVKKRGVLLGDWYRGIITPATKLSQIGYTEGSCPIAEKYADTVINLPTYPLLTKGQAGKVVSLLKLWLHTK